MLCRILTFMWSMRPRPLASLDASASTELCEETMGLSFLCVFAGGRVLGFRTADPQIVWGLHRTSKGHLHLKLFMKASSKTTARLLSGRPLFRVVA